MLRNYSNTATEAILSGSVTSADTTINLTSFAGYPAPPFTAAIERGTPSEEIVLVTAVSGATVTATRGFDGTTAKSHAAGAQFLHVTVARDYDEANDHVNATSGVHGAAGPVVGTTDVQTLTNKTLVAPALQTLTATGTSAFAGATFSGTVSFATTVTLASFTATSAALTGDLTVGGTLTSTGLLTASGGVSAPQVSATATAPTLPAHLVRKDYADALGTAAATVSTIMRRDPSGRTAVVAGAAATDAVNKAQVEAYFVTPPTTRSIPKLLGTGTTIPSSGMIAGDTYRHTGTGGGLLIYSGAAWQYAAPRVIQRTWDSTASGGFDNVPGGGFSETGTTAGFPALATLITVVPTVAQVDLIVRTNASVFGAGASLAYARIDGANATRQTLNRSGDSSQGTTGSLALAAGTHTPTVRFESFGGITTVAYNATLTITLGVAE